MNWVDSALIAAAGFAAGAINTIVGAGSLITYPVLVFLGVPPVVANISNTIGLSPGSISGAWAYRHELADQKARMWRLIPVTLIGAITGAVLLTMLPRSAFKVVVPFLILISSLLVGIQPWLSNHKSRNQTVPRDRHPAAIQTAPSARLTPAVRTRWMPLTISVFLASIYGGYFSAAQGVILLGLLGLFMTDGLQRQNALKNLLQAVVNVVAAIFFIALGGVSWYLVALLAAGSLVGAPAGAYIAKRVPTKLFRIGIVIFGIAMAYVMTRL